MDPCIVDYSVEIPTRCSFVIEFIIPKLFKGSICFERHTAHNQELETICSLWFIRCNKVKDFVYIIHSPYYNITIVFLI